INPRTSLVTVSLGSGAAADVIFLFTCDICGESGRSPRHARAWGDLAKLQKGVRDERVKALAGFRSDVRSGGFPAAHETVAITEAELVEFRLRLDDAQK